MLHRIPLYTKELALLFNAIISPSNFQYRYPIKCCFRYRNPSHSLVVVPFVRNFLTLLLQLILFLMSPITIDNIIQASERIQVHRTPVQTCTALNDLASEPNAPVELFFKCELFQKTGCKFVISSICRNEMPISFPKHSNLEVQAMPLLF